MGRISPGPTRWPPGAERRLVPAKSNLKPQTLAAAGLLAVGAGLEARSGGVPRGLGGGVLDEDVVVVVDEVVVVVEVVESEAEEKAVGDGGGSWASGAGV